ncbi:permease-like cell division protein FtsX [Sansalvadorimonas verongulae]|uniref:permease-like cell division protein FtsX n=1 Tax=Sansalvadorimonas verongulae TaxID=2172824 RepID=UPI0012BD6414|nr:permease-like cell division protein FtsX [Sansalvadorimonas verongulae]MTI13414.1 FtsX-like permease family protein [Sansalvadorimonas verongulae]
MSRTEKGLRARARQRKAAVTTWRKTSREKPNPKPKPKVRQRKSHGQSISALDNWTSLIGLHRRVSREALSRILSTPLASLITVLVLAVAMSLPAVLSMALDNLREVAGSNQMTSARASMYLKSNISDAQALQLRESLAHDAAIEQATYISPAQGLTEFEKYSGLGEALRQLDENPLPGVIEIVPKDVSPLAVSNLRNRLSRMTGVDEVRVDSAWLKRLQSILKLGNRIFTGVSVLIALAVLLAVGNTIRLLVMNRTEEIRVIKLVGGSDGFVILPFLYSGFWYGLLGGLSAAVITATLWSSVAGPAQELASLYQSSFRPGFPGLAITFTLIVSGMIMGVGGAFLASWRQLRRIDP